MALKLRGQWMPVFRSGTQTDSSGKTRTYTNGDLDTMVQKFEEAGNPAPLVIGHPETNGPAYGWTDKLRRKGNELQARIEKVLPQFEEWVESGAYRTRSISHYADLTLRHVGFLGAVPPAVKGLPNEVYAFGEEDKESVVVEFSSDELPVQNQNGLQKLANAFASYMKELNPNFNEEDEMGKETDEKLDALNSGLQSLNTNIAALVQNFSSQPAPAPAAAPTVEPEESPEMKALREENETLKTNAKTSEENARKQSFSEFCDGLIEKGTMLQADKENSMDMLEVAYQSDSSNFSEGKKETPKVDRMKAMLGSAKGFSLFGEFCPEQNPKKRTGSSTVVSEFSEEELDDESVEISNRAHEIMKAEKISFEEAVDKAYAEVN